MKNDSVSWLGALVIGYLAFLGFADMWHSDTRYSMQYDVNPTDIHRSKRPSECDFLTAPLGFKGCRYDRNVEFHVVLTRENPFGYSVVSYGNGKTWQPNDKNAKPERYVTISWVKIED